MDAAKTGRPDPVPGIVLELPAHLFRWYGRLLLVLAALLFVLLLVDTLAGAPESYLLPGVILLAATLFLGLLFRGLAGAMHDRNPWVYLIAFVISGGLAAVSVVQLFIVPAPPGPLISQEAATIRTWVGLVLFGSAAFCTLLALVLVLSRESD